MATGERFRTGGARGVARFLADHQRCDSGFDVQREVDGGSGRMTIKCLGCGRSVTYKTGELREFPIAASGEGPTTAGNGVPAGARTRDPRGGRGAAAAAPRGDGGRARQVPRWVPRALIGALAAAGVVAAAVALLGSGDDSDEQAAPAASQPAAPAPAAPAEPATQARPAVGPDDIRLGRLIVLERFVIGLPRGWGQAGSPEEGFTFAPRGDAAAVRVFYEAGERDLDELGDLAAVFLEQRYPEAEIGGPKAVRFGGGPAERARARLGAGGETAYVVARDGYSYLILERADRGADERRRAEAAAVARSFRPR